MDKKELKKIFTPKQYQVELFSELGFSRKECTNCGNKFWTLNPDRKTCGETVCEGGYKFIGQKGQNWDFHQTISHLTSFFEKNGHTAINAYPVVARWRDDLDFTIASIADFQPWVTNGTLPPPANPLVVPQPCIRFGGEFSDIDNVGRTGRHLTTFIMFGQHSFNSSKLKNGYWMDRCIELNYKFLTEELKIDANDLTYIEGIWMGGGNFGPNLESFSQGSEIVNSVFMQYENTPTGYKEMDLKVIDVGWGTERTSWFSQGKPTIYEATFGPVHDYLLKETGITVNKDLVSGYSKLAGLIDINENPDVKKARSSIAEKLGYTLQDLNQELSEIEAIYQIGDHSRTIAFALSDGSIPSNVGGGYNLRNMLRRLYTINEAMGFNLDLVDILERTALYVSNSFPRIKESIKLSATIFDVEKTRYDKTIDTGRKYVSQLVKSKKKVTDDTLVELYTSRGIPPETVQSVAKEKGIAIEIPADFFHKVDLALPKAEKNKEEKEEIDLEKIKELNTEPLYYDLNPKPIADAKVTAILDTGHLVLDRTVFYPLGGGQAEDHGWIYLGRQKLTVVDVKKFGSAIVHKVNKLPSNIKIGSKVKLEVDWERRLALMRHHTAVHIVGGAAREVLGQHVWQAGADKTPDRGRLDITHWESISRETLDEIEFVANSVVMDNRRVNKYVMKRTEAEQKYGFTIYQGGVVPGKELRIVEIPGLDTEACGGTHANMTGDIGYIRIVSAERIQDGIVRLTITAGKKAVLKNQHDFQLLTESANIFSVPFEDLPSTSERFFNEWKDKSKEIERLNKELAVAKVPQLISSAKDYTTKSGEKIKIIMTQLNSPQAELINLGEQISQLTEKEGNILGIILGEFEKRAMVIVSKSKGSKYNLNKIIRPIAEILGGGGGGKKDVVAGGGPKIEMLPKAMKETHKIIIDNL